HTVKGSAAQVGLRRLGGIAHRVGGLIGRLRDGEIQHSPSRGDVCLESVDVLKKTLHREWADEAEFRAGVDSLLGRIAAFAPQEVEEEAPAVTIAETEEEVPVKATGEKAAPKAPLTAKQVAANKSVR